MRGRPQPVLPQEVRPSSPAAPPSGGVQRYHKKIAGRIMSYLLGDTGAERIFGGAIWSRTWVLVTPQSTTTVRTTGTGAAASATGTVSHPGWDKTYGFPAQIASAASLNGVASLATGSTPPITRGATADIAGGFFIHSRVRLPDASYDNTGATTGSRIWGVAAYSSSGNTLLQNARGGTQQLVGFNRENVNGSNTDTTWQFVTNDGTTVNVTDTGMAFTIGHVYDFWIWCPLGSTTIYWQVNDVTAGTTKSGSTTSNLPAAGTNLNPIAGLLTVDATARNFQFLRFFYETDKG